MHTAFLQMRRTIQNLLGKRSSPAAHESDLSPFWSYYVAGYVEQPQLWYCQSATSSADTFDTATNPWPPTAGSTMCRAGYAARQELANGTDVKAEITFPRLIFLADQAIISDWVSMSDALNRHNGSMNVLYGNGAVKNVQGNDTITTNLILMPRPHSTSGNIPVANIFKELDAGR